MTNEWSPISESLEQFPILGCFFRPHGAVDGLHLVSSRNRSEIIELLRDLQAKKPDSVSIDQVTVNGDEYWWAISPGPISPKYLPVSPMLYIRRPERADPPDRLILKWAMPRLFAHGFVLLPPGLILCILAIFRPELFLDWEDGASSSGRESFLWTGVGFVVLPILFWLFWKFFPKGPTISRVSRLLDAEVGDGPPLLIASD